MEQQPLISIITVTYNAGKVISKTLQSLKNQTFRDFEHLIIDGASKDETLDIVKDYGLTQTKVISEPDKGLYDAMNKGIRLANGKFILFLNAGDSFHSDSTLACYSEQAKNNYDIIFGDTIIVDGNGNKIADRHLSAPQKLTKNSFSDGMLICHQAFMVKKELAPSYNLDYRFSADYDWCINCISKTNPDNCKNLNQVTIDYLSDGLTDKNKWKSLRERFKIMAWHYGLIKTTSKHLGFILRAARRGKI